MASSCRLALTTMRQDTLLAGELLVDVLLAQLGAEPVDSHLMQPQLIVRESCGSL